MCLSTPFQWGYQRHLSHASLSLPVTFHYRVVVIEPFTIKCTHLKPLKSKGGVAKEPEGIPGGIFFDYFELTLK